MTNKNREARGVARQRETRIRAAAFGAVVVGVLALAGWLLASALFRAGPPPTAGNVIDIAADMSGFSLPEIRVKAGQPVTVRLTSLDTPYHSDGGGKHQWAVDELGVSIIAPPEGSASSSFTPATPGTYTFYCDICCGGRANPSIQGTLIVEA